MKDSPKRLGWRFAFIGGTYHSQRQEKKKIAKSSGSCQDESGTIPSFSLCHTQVGDRVCIVSLSNHSDNPYLRSLGLVPGIQLEIISRTPSGSVIVACSNNTIGLGAYIANFIRVTNMPIAIADKTEKKNNTTYLRDLPVGTRGRIVGYDRVFRGYIGKLFSMGLTPGKEFTTIRHAFLDYPLQIEQEGKLLNLRKQEADALCVETIEDEEREI